MSEVPSFSITVDVLAPEDIGRAREALAMAGLRAFGASLENPEPSTGGPLHLVVWGESPTVAQGRVRGAMSEFADGSYKVGPAIT